ncbi:tetratricopeptide repeat protein [Desertibaculum subflavum]|uniref:tetratricopeptide repeat protein n=1 Tax=Desertibaculum subflavum TaxID=2268458 RepID=UPI0013C529FE
MPVTTGRAETVEAIDRFTAEFLGYGQEAGVIVPAASADPGCALAQTLAGALHLFLENAEAPRLAAPFLAAAESGAADVTAREREHLAAARAWAAGDTATAAERYAAVARAHPRDLLAAKFAQYHFFNLGRLDEHLAVAEIAAAANGDVAWSHGMLAFGLEQCHRLPEAERAGRRAVEMMADEPWAHHAVAHVMETQGRLDEGIAWLEGFAPLWQRCNSFMLTHNWWHLALFRIDREEPGAALDIYDRHVWGVWKQYSQDQVNAASLLWRLELRGADVGERWRDLADHVEARGAEHVEPFLDLHYVYALARGERREAFATFMESLRRYAVAAPPRWREVALPAAEGVVAHAQGDMRGAFAKLDPLAARWGEIGGSHAQRDLFVQTWLDAALRSGQGNAVRRVLEARAAARPAISVHRRQLAEGSLRS